MKRTDSLAQAKHRVVTAAALAVALTASQAPASTVLPSLEDYPYEPSEAVEAIFQSLIQSGNVLVPAITRDPITLYFEAELETADVRIQEIGGRSAAESPELAALADATPKAGEKITGSFTYNPNRNLLIERVQDAPGAQGLTYEEIDALLGAGQYSLWELSYAYDGETHTYTRGAPLPGFLGPDGALDPNVTEEMLRSSRSVVLKNGLGEDSVGFATAAQRRAEVTTSTAHRQACQGQLEDEALRRLGLDTRPGALMGLNVSGPDFLPGSARDLTQTVYTQGQTLTANTFSLGITDFLAPLQSAQAVQLPGLAGIVDSACLAALEAFYNSIPIIRSFSATGRITYLSPTQIPTSSPPPVAPVPVPPALGLGLTWLLMLWGLRRRAA